MACHLCFDRTESRRPLSIRCPCPADRRTPSHRAEVLSNPKQETKVLRSEAVSRGGKTYYTFEFASKAPSYIRHALAVVAVNNGKFYTLSTGANERRWGKMQDRLKTVVDSFEVLF